MHNSNIPSSQELPSSAKLFKSTLIAVVTAVVILVTIVMPAEYGIDPTGVGKALGLKRMGEIKVSLAKEAELDAQMDAIATVQAEAPLPVEIEKTPALNSHEMSLTLAPDEGSEIKVTMPKGAAVNYLWQTSGGKANFDVHGDSKALDISYHNYYKGSDIKREGTLVAAFDGSHGWFWRNRTSKPLTITLTTSGDYSEIKRY